MTSGTAYSTILPALEQRIAQLESENARLKVALAAGTVADAAAQQLFAVVETFRQGVVVHRGGPALYANHGLAAMLGLASREAFMASPSALDFVHPEDRPLVAAAVSRFLAGEPMPTTGEFRLIRVDGSVLWVESSTSRVIWDGAPAVATAINDIGARKAAERELRRSQQLFQTAFEACPDAMSLSEFETGRFVDVNQSWVRVSGYDRSEVIGRTSRELGLFADLDVLSRLNDLLDHRGEARNLETLIRTRDGEMRDFIISAEVLRLDDRLLLLTVARDITERRRQEEELRRSREAAERANRSKSEFLASMSHELRTPLNAIIGFSEVIRDQLFGPLGTPRYAEYAADIHRSGEHLLNIINDLLDLSKLEAGKLELCESKVAPVEVIEDCLRLVRGRAENAGVALGADLPAALPALHADPRLLKQILINLLSNAVKFTPAGGRVTAGARQEPDGSLALYVADTGIGMSPEDVTVALTPFGQVDGGLARRHEGTGLGLPLAQQLARLHGGELLIDSTPGVGTTVTVTMPATRVLGPADGGRPDSPG